MKISTRLSAIVLSALAAISIISCEKPVPEPEDNGNTFTYEGNTYKVRSVVLYELENNMTQIWMSETAGYTTVDEIEASVGELVLTIPTGKIGNGKQSANESNVGNLIRYDGKRNSGFYTFTCNKDESAKTITIEFSSQNLKSSAKNAIEGSYSGPYSEYTLAELQNQWAYNREARAITGVDYFEMEDGEPSRLVIYENDNKAIELTLAKKHIGVPVIIGGSSTPAETEVLFDNGEEFKIESAYGSISVGLSNEQIAVSIKLTNEGGKTLTANYTGAYRFRYGNKTNRCIYSSGSEGGNGYDGTFLLSSMKVSESDKVTFTFTPGEHLGGGQIFATNPTLTVDNSLIGLGEVNTQDISYALSFKYYTFQLDTQHTEAIPGSVINVEKSSDGTYTVNAELAYVSGTVTKYRDMVDENGNVVTEWVEEFDELSGEIIQVEKAKQEEYQEDVITTIDLFYNGPATND